MTSVKTPLISSMHAVVARLGIDGGRNPLALELEVGRAVVADVDLENPRLAGPQASVMLSFASVPLTVSSPCLSFGCLSSALCLYEAALRALYLWEALPALCEGAA